MVDNNIIDCHTGNGIWLSESSNNVISGNDFTYCHGIKLTNSDNNEILENNFANCPFGITLLFSSNNNIERNNFNNWFNGNGIILFVSSNNLISGNYLEHCWTAGISCIMSDDNTITENFLYWNAQGIGLETCSRNIISKNTVVQSTLFMFSMGAIDLAYSDNNQILENNITENSKYGININSGSYNNITRNSIINKPSNNVIGGIRITSLSIMSSNHNTILKNEISNVDNYGIYLTENTNDNTIKENTIKNSGLIGLFLSNLPTNNMVYLNIFVGNGQNAEDHGTNNQWDNDTIGNYWDDYVGIDANGDGIGDDPHNIPGPAGSVDNFPITDIQPDAHFTCETLIYEDKYYSFSFDGLEGNGPATFSWDFGDGSTSNEINPYHIYDNPGTYEVVLNITDIDGDSDKHLVVIEVIENFKPTAQFTVSNTITTVGDTVLFTFTGDSGDEPARFCWGFGDGTYSYEENTTHPYDILGIYPVFLLVADDSGDYAFEIREDFIIVNDIPIITHPEDITYDIGDTGNEISWTVTDTMSNNCQYIVVIDGEIYETGPWVSGLPIEINVDELDVGTYTYTIIISDGYEGIIWDEVEVEVEDVPIIPATPYIIVAMIVAFVSVSFVLNRKIKRGRNIK